MIQNGSAIAHGTAIATFKNMHFQSGNGHAAFFAGLVAEPNPQPGKPNIRIVIVDQYQGSGTIILRKLKNYGKDANGNYINSSNNGEAFAVIL
jgi:hypothetical protein